MSTCKDCLHYAVCMGWNKNHDIHDGCECFTDKSSVVEVVRCNDCSHFNDEDEYCPVLGFCEPNEYCSRSERRKEDGEIC